MFAVSRFGGQRKWPAVILIPLGFRMELELNQTTWLGIGDLRRKQEQEKKERMEKPFRLEVALAVLLVCLMFVPAAIAADTAKVSGEWALTVETPDGTGTPSVIFKQDGQNLTGTYKGRFGESQLKGSVKGNEIKFSITISPQGQELVVEYSGTVDGDSMKGKVKFGEFGEGNFTGKKKSGEAAK